jgi:hypothetical protein
MLFRRLVLLLVVSSMLLTTAAAQQRDKKPKSSPKAQAGLTEEAEQLRLNAVSLLHSLAQNANEIDKIEDRVTVLAEIGDAFWPVDREYARATLVRSFKEIDKLAPGTSDDEKEGVAAQKRHLSQVVLYRIAKREPTLAKQLLEEQSKQTPTPTEKAYKLYGVTSPSADALLSIAQTLIATDPQRAATIASYSLQDGVSQRFRYFLIHLRAKNSDMADVLVTEAISQLGRQHPGNLFDVMMLWDYAYQPADFYFNGISWNRESPEAGFIASVELKRLVLNYALTTIVENLQQLPKSESAQDRTFVEMQLGALHSVIQQLLPSMQADLPRGAADLQQALVRVEQELRANGGTPPSRPPTQDSAEETSALDQMIEDASKASQGEARDNLYFGAALKLFQSRQFERAKEIASRIDNQEKRTQIIELVNFSLCAELVKKKKLQEAWDVANQLKTIEYRMCSLARVGRAFLESGDTQSGMQALTAAQSLMSKSDPSVELAAAALRVAAAFSDLVRVSEGIGLAIQVMNKAKLDGTPWSLMGSTGEEDSLLLDVSYMAGGAGGITVLRSDLPQAGGFGDVLARLDFNEAIALAKTVNKKPLSVMAQADVCRRTIEATESSHKEAQKAQKVQEE